MIGAEHSPGMEVTTGSLAQGLSMASGVAWARLRKKEPGKVWVYMSDGEFQEGQTWECLAAMSYHKIDNIRVIVDVNRQQCDGAMSSVLDLGDLAARVASFGVTCRSVDVMMAFIAPGTVVLPSGGHRRRLNRNPAAWSRDAPIRCRLPIAPAFASRRPISGGRETRRS